MQTTKDAQSSTTVPDRTGAVRRRALTRAQERQPAHAAVAIRSTRTARGAVPSITAQP